MFLRRRSRALPLRVWLILAVVAIIGAGFLAQIGLTLAMTDWQQQAEANRMNTVRRVLGTDSSQWGDPTWQRQAANSLGPLGVEAAVYAEPAGKMIYATAGARQLLGDAAPASARTSDSAALTQAPDSPFGQSYPAFQRLVISTPAANGLRPIGFALLWLTRPAPGGPSARLWPRVELGTFALVLAVVVWLVGWPVLRPLSAMNRAVEDIAGGDLNISVKPSPVREIAEVSAALEGMSVALGHALARQNALEEERRLFVGAIAHDLRTPLFMLRGYLKGLESGIVSPPEKAAHYVALCRARADDLERLIADLFAYTRLEYLGQGPERLPFDFGALLQQSVADTQSAATARSVSLVVDAPEHTYPVTGDARLLARAVDNLLSNALRYTPDGGSVTARLSQQDGMLRFAIEDTGPGFAERDLPHIFTPLYRGDPSRNRQTGGAGLGLAIAQRILRAHGGDLQASNAPAGGALVTGTLPASRNAEVLNGAEPVVTRRVENEVRG